MNIYTEKMSILKQLQEEMRAELIHGILPFWMGRMVDVETGQEFVGAPVEVKKVTAWMQSQIDAGKIEEA